MAENRPEPRAPRCIHLSCKAMMVHGEDFEADPEFQDGVEDFECLKTFTLLGPDNGEASLELCSNPNRRCYEEY